MDGVIMRDDGQEGVEDIVRFVMWERGEGVMDDF